METADSNSKQEPDSPEHPLFPSNNQNNLENGQTINLNNQRNETG